MIEDLLISDFTNKDFQKAFKQYYHELGICVRHWDTLFSEMNEDNDNLAYIRMSDAGQVIGFIQFKPIALSNWFFTTSMGFIREFWIAKEYRGKGYGTELSELVETYFINHGIFKSILTTDTAPGFYEKNGYKKDCSVTARNKDDVYIKELNGP